MILRYCKGYVDPAKLVPIKSSVISSVTDSDGNTFSIEVDEKFDMSIYGNVSDWSLDAMVKAGINPESFTSPTVFHTRLEAAEAVNNINIPENLSE